MLPYLEFLWLLRDLPEMMQRAERLFSGKGRGAEKKQFVLDTAFKMIVLTERTLGRDIADEGMVRNGLSWAIDGVHAMMTGFRIWEVEPGIGVGARH